MIQVHRTYTVVILALLGVFLAAALAAQSPVETEAKQMPGAKPDSSPASSGATTALEMTYFGAAGWRITDGATVVLVDPWPSRVKYGGGGHPDDDRPSYTRTDIAPVDTALVDRLIPEADFILMQHGHFDHLGDVPYIAKKTGAKVIGTETVIMILRAYGVPDEQLYAVQGGEDYQFENFSVRVVPGLHSALDNKHYHDSRRYDRDTPLEAPLRIEQFIEGGALSFLVRLGGRSVLTMGSMNFIEREFEGLNPDILLAGINGSRLGLYDFDRRLLSSTGFPSVIIPTHWDNFRLPYGFSQQANIERNLEPFVETARVVSPSSTVIIPVHLEPIVVP
ncbi:MAG: MBL fold metallo-hydrolase [Congregibacter sp.]